MRRLLLMLSAAAFLWGALIMATGGIQWKIAGVLFRSRAPDRALLVALALVVVQAIVFRDAFARDIARLAARVRRFLPAIAAACAIALAVFAVRFSSCTAGSADAYGYVSQAYLWANGTLPRAQPMPLELPWPSGDLSLAPLGYRPGPQPHTMVPTYAPGLPLMMAAAIPFGPCGPFLIVPLLAAVTVWLTFRLGQRTDGVWTGALAAVLVATSPIVQMQALLPMSDVPAAALGAGAAYAALGTRRRDAVVCGLWAAGGLLVRPNLTLIPLVLFVHIALATAGRERWNRLVLYATPVAAAAAVIAVLNTMWYGAPWNSGYGSSGDLFSASSIIPNLRRYPVWLWRSQSPLVLVALVPWLPWFRRAGHRHAVRLCAALFGVTLVSYLVYFPFEEWWYLRFLLPAIPSLLVLVAAGLVFIGRRMPAWGRPAVAVLATLIVILTARFSGANSAPAPLRDGERRYVYMGSFVRDSLPPNAAVLAIQESGSIRYYGARLTIRWDLIDRDWIARAPAVLEAKGLHPYLVAEDFELPQLRETLGLPPEATIPWPLAVRMRERGGISLYDLASGAVVATPVALNADATPLCTAPQPLVLEPARR